MTYYQIDDKTYYFNLDTLFALVCDSPNSEKLVNTTITEYYGEGSNNGKEIVESRSSLNETMNNVRYDFVKYLTSCLLSNGFNADGSPLSVMHLKDLSMGQVLCLNTLIEYKILCEVENNE